MIEVSSQRDFKFLLSGLLCLALVARVVALFVYSENLLDDRDSYLNLAQHLAAGHGFSTTEGTPTAYRPPLYPLMLSVGGRLFAVEAAGALKFWVGGVNLCCSLITIWIVWCILARHASRDLALWAVFLLAVNPFLIYNVTLPMTETLCAMLVVGFVGALANADGTIRRQGWVGVWFGLCVLCRPTLWAFAGIWFVATVVQCFRSGEWKRSVRRSIPTVVMTSLVVAPWIIRNALTFGAFIPMTTHGGYTLLLANNEVFYSEIVDRSWRETWKGESLSRWQASIDREWNDISPNPPTETESSRWMTKRAMETIRSQPTTFLRACGVRFLRFWNLVPLSSEGRTTPRLIEIGMFAYGGIIYLGMIASIWKIASVRLVAIGWCLTASFVAVHLVYWSNLRMRVPLEPVLVMLAVLGFAAWRKCRESEG